MKNEKWTRIFSQSVSQHVSLLIIHTQSAAEHVLITQSLLNWSLSNSMRTEVWENVCVCLDICVYSLTVKSVSVPRDGADICVNCES